MASYTYTKLNAASIMNSHGIEYDLLVLPKDNHVLVNQNLNAQKIWPFAVVALNSGIFSISIRGPFSIGTFLYSLNNYLNIFLSLC